jgi:uncharacterized repeat protein (TIGR03803 family)
VAGANGVFFGTTLYGEATVGCDGRCGAVFELSPPSAPGGAWTEAVLYNFTGETNGDGNNPVGLLYLDGVLYGTTAFGGAEDFGTVFELTPPSESGGAWSEAVLYSFTGLSDGASPSGGLISGANGALYGVNSKLGSSGTAYGIVP